MFRRRLTIALGTLAVASLMQGAVAWWAIDAAAQSVQRGRVASDVLAGFLELSATKQRLRSWQSQALFDAGADPKQRDRLQGDMAATLAALDADAARAVTLDGARAAAGDEHRQRQDALAVLRRSLGELTAAMALASPLPPGADAVVAWAELTRVFDTSQGRDLRSLLTESIKRERAAVARERAAANRSLGLVRALALGATLALALAAAVLALHFTRALRRPLEQLSAGAEALQRGDLAHRIPERLGDEFGRFARRVNAMADELGQHREREALARQRLEELVQARTAELQQALLTLQQLDERRRRLFADVSHELRTPTTVIRGEAEIALRGQPKPAEEYQHSLRRIVGVSQQLGTVIDDLLTMARSDSDALALTRVPLVVAEPLQEAIEQARALGHERRVAVDGPFHGVHNGAGGAAAAAVASATRVLGDAQRLCQLFTLLLDNAVRYSKPADVVHVEVLQPQTADGEAAQWQLRITDQGIGIDAEALPQVFDRNFRSERARLHRADGSGLGLPIAAALARAHGGFILIDSEPGRGTVVTLSLPILWVEAESSLEEPA